MDFVKVMGIAKRLYESDEYNPVEERYYPEWFMRVWATTGYSNDELVTFQRELLTWAEQHPEQTKEEKTVEKRTKVHELLGVEAGEPVDLVYVRPDGSESAHHKNVVFDDNGYLHDQNKKMLSMFNLADAVNGLLQVRRRPALTDEQRDTLVALDRLGFTHVAKNQDGSVIATVGEPYNLTSENYQWHAMDEDELGCEVITEVSKLNCLRPLLPDWTKPLDIQAKLKEAGV
jgi:hypothetical protein